ncbi:a-factor receptor [Serendipita sp. 399]|nr:a-factor receptor [Serendipita sp. 399]
MGDNGLRYLFPAYPIVCILAAILTLLPLPAHWLAGNTGATALGLWVLGGNVIAAVNTIVWHGNLRNPHPIWGDICQVYFSIMNFAIIGATLSIQYNLWRVVRNKQLYVTIAERRRQKIVVICLCYGLPLLFAVLHYIIQGHRYDIVEDVGPVPTTTLSPVSFAIYFLWDPILCLITIALSLHTYWMVLQRRGELSKLFISGKKNNESRFYRLLAMTLVQTLIHFPIGLFTVLFNATQLKMSPWISWDDTHFDYMRILYFPRTTVESTPNAVMKLSISFWTVPLCGFLYFLFFGTGKDARRQYRMACKICSSGGCGRRSSGRVATEESLDTTAGVPTFKKASIIVTTSVVRTRDEDDDYTEEHYPWMGSTVYGDSSGRVNKLGDLEMQVRSREEQGQQTRAKVQSKAPTGEEEITF